jgi:RNA polymerase sigma factor (sigma-70 family)
MVERLVMHDRGALRGDSPETLALDQMRDRDLIEAVRRLPRRHRSLIALRYGAGLSAAEIAECMGTTRMAAAKALRRALDRLRADLTDLEVTE